MIISLFWMLCNKYYTFVETLNIFKVWKLTFGAGRSRKALGACDSLTESFWSSRKPNMSSTTAESSIGWSALISADLIFSRFTLIISTLKRSSSCSRRLMSSMVSWKCFSAISMAFFFPYFFSNSRASCSLALRARNSTWAKIKLCTVSISLYESFTKRPYPKFPELFLSNHLAHMTLDFDHSPHFSLKVLADHIPTTSSLQLDDMSSQMFELVRQDPGSDQGLKPHVSCPHLMILFLPIVSSEVLLNDHSRCSHL